MRPLGRDRAPSDMVRSQSASRSVQVPLPPTPAEALARAQLLLDFPPTTGKLDEWRATIRSLVAVANKDEPSTVGPPVDAPMESHAPVAERPAAPQPRCIHLFLIQYRGHRLVAMSWADISIASSDPRTHCDQRQVLRERAHEDARTTIERRHGARHQSDRRAGPCCSNHPPATRARLNQRPAVR